jgi:hypothetical protein
MHHFNCSLDSARKWLSWRARMQVTVCSCRQEIGYHISYKSEKIHSFLLVAHQAHISQAR